MTHPAVPPFIQLANVRVRLGGTEILRGVSAGIPRGRMTAILGLNGAGKTTLLKVLLGEIAFEGVVGFHCGHDHSHPSPRNVGYVPQRLRVEANLPLTVRDLFALALNERPMFMGTKRDQAKHLAMLTVVRAGHGLLDRWVETLSGGELQRVMLALALEPHPELLLLDEPASGIDFLDKLRYYDDIAAINASEGTTVVLVSHELELVRRHAHHVIALNKGVVAFEGPPDQLPATGGLDSLFVRG